MNRIFVEIFYAYTLDIILCSLFDAIIVQNVIIHEAHMMIKTIVTYITDW